MSYINKIIASVRSGKASPAKHTVDAKGNPKGKGHLSKHKAGHWGPDGHGDRSASGLIAKGINAGKQVVDDVKQVVDEVKTKVENKEGLLQKRGKKKKGKGLKSACWKGYEAIGMKKKGGRKVPNCVPKKK